MLPKGLCAIVMGVSPPVSLDKMDSVAECMYSYLLILSSLIIGLIMVLTSKVDFSWISSCLQGQLRPAFIDGGPNAGNSKTCTHSVGSKGMILRDESGVTLTIPENAIPYGRCFDISMNVAYNADVPTHQRSNRAITPIAEFTTNGEFESYVHITFPIKDNTKNVSVFYRNNPKDPWLIIRDHKENDMYYVMKEKSVTIFTRHFTEFVCIDKCNTESITLSAYMFASLYEDEDLQDLQLDVFIVHTSVRPDEHYDFLQKRYQAVPCGEVNDLTKDLSWNNLQIKDQLEIKCVVQDRGWFLSSGNKKHDFVAKTGSLADLVRCHIDDQNDFRATFHYESDNQNRLRVLVQLRFIIERKEEREQVYTWTKKIEIEQLRDLVRRRKGGEIFDRRDALSTRSARMIQAERESRRGRENAIGLKGEEKTINTAQQSLHEGMLPVSDPEPAPVRSVQKDSLETESIHEGMLPVIDPESPSVRSVQKDSLETADKKSEKGIENVIGLPDKEKTINTAQESLHEGVLPVSDPEPAPVRWVQKDSLKKPEMESTRGRQSDIRLQDGAETINTGESVRNRRGGEENKPEMTRHTGSEQTKPDPPKDEESWWCEIL